MDFFSFRRTSLALNLYNICLYRPSPAARRAAPDLPPEGALATSLPPHPTPVLESETPQPTASNALQVGRCPPHHLSNPRPPGLRPFRPQSPHRGDCMTAFTLPPEGALATPFPPHQTSMLLSATPRPAEPNALQVARCPPHHLPNPRPPGLRPFGFQRLPRSLCRLRRTNPHPPPGGRFGDAPLTPPDTNALKRNTPTSRTKRPPARSLPAAPPPQSAPAWAPPVRISKAPPEPLPPPAGQSSPSPPEGALATSQPPHRAPML